MILLMLFAFALLFIGGQALASGASELSEKIGLTKAFVGLVVVSLGTSALELASDARARVAHPCNAWGCAYILARHTIDDCYHGIWHLCDTRRTGNTF